MLGGNLNIILAVLIPIFLYTYLVYYMVPYSFISLKRARRYFVSGLISPLLVILFYFLYPKWSQFILENGFLSILFLSIIQIGVLEETCKYAIFKWVSLERPSYKHDLPIAIIFYSLVTALGFALTENFGYLISFYKYYLNSSLSDAEVNHSLMSIALLRSISAVITHMVCGVIMGYFILKSIEEKERFLSKEHSRFSHRLNFKSPLYILAGIGASACFHGVYNLNFMLPYNMYSVFYGTVTVLFGLVIGYFIIKEAIRSSKIKRLTKLN